MNFRNIIMAACAGLAWTGVPAENGGRTSPSAAARGDMRPPMKLRAVGVPAGAYSGPAAESQLRVMAAFKERHPGLELLPATGIEIPGRSMDTQPLMQIAGDVSPDVIYVNFRQSDTYIRNKFLHPLETFLERVAGVEIPNGHLLSTDAYYAAISRGANFETEISTRMPRVVWDVVRRECPHGEKCPYIEGSPARHHHIWAIPQNQMVMALFYRRDIFAEAGLPDRAPDTVEELLDWARRVTNPAERTHGLTLPPDTLGWRTLAILYSYGGRVVEQDDGGVWRCVFDSPEAAAAYALVARLFLEPFENGHGKFPSTVGAGDLTDPGARFAMWFGYIDQNALQNIDPETVGFGPAPMGPTGLRGAEYNSSMHGLYAGTLDNNPALREVAWDYVWFYGGREANRIFARTLAENGLGRFVSPALLRDAGLEEWLADAPEGWEAANAAAFESGVPEPYGRNCQLVYQYMSRAIDQILNDGEVRRLIRDGGRRSPSAAANGDVRPPYFELQARAAEILRLRVEDANQKMLGNLPDDVRRFRNRVSAVVVALVVASFVLVFWLVFKTFKKAVSVGGTVTSRTRRGLAWLMLLPALMTIGVWEYWPLMRGTVMAFQDYNVRGFSEWAGLDNFSAALFNTEFWHSMLISVKFTALTLAFGFFAPIILAVLLSEVPRGKILFRSVYYLPAVLSGVIVMFLWKGFYGPTGLFNQLLNGCVNVLNALAGTRIGPFASDWLREPRAALLACILPTVWAGMGPGCLIYLAALKTVPEDIYEAADIDGAGMLSKIRHITVPHIMPLVAINFIGAVIGAMKTGGAFMLAMTGGGPYTPFGATEVVGLHIFWEAFGYLRFGTATAMAWVLGSMLVGFTVYQLRRLSRMQFKTAGGTDK